MLFNSFTFLIFFLLFYSLYLVSRHNLKIQNALLILGGCIFYGWWDWRFLSLLFFTLCLDYFVAKAIYQAEEAGRKKLLLQLSIAGNLGVLGFFKYFNFFAESFAHLLSVLGLPLEFHLISVILPIGISFYTFVSMSYTIDVYRGRLAPAESLFDFAVFVTFFPPLLAGPISRASQLLHQLTSVRKINLDQFYTGCYLIFWGLFKKFTADSLGQVVNTVFNQPGPNYDSLQVVAACYAFAFQIYCDFSGYTDIARGLGKCMGVELPLNFNLPYCATNPVEFWRRWHISLSTWLRDYLYIPLGGNRKGDLLTYRNIFITMLLGGLWHGASWTFVLWGCYHGFLLIAYRAIKPYLDALPRLRNQSISGIWNVCKMFFFFNLVCLGWLIFRVKSITQAWQMLKSLAFKFEVAGIAPSGKDLLINVTMFVSILLIIQGFQYYKNDRMVLSRIHWLPRGIIYFVFFVLMISYRWNIGKEFIYFQF